MHRLKTRLAATLGVSVLLAAGATQMTEAAAKKTHRLTMTCKGKLTGSNSSTGTCTSSLGRNRYKIVLTPPTYKQTDTFPGGKIYATGSVRIAKGKAVGSIRITRGTGKFRGITGRGSYSTAVTSSGAAVTTRKITVKY